ncbi:MAG TPA: RIP metalloprotease RseP, partial [Parafilimonas sp.]|nr:RIP metalloprotease RseP [Parafilimonas sp.]
MTLLSIDWPGIGIKTLQLIFSLSILVTLHELGHFLTARWFKCRVEKFYLFFDPWFSVWKKKIGETIYGIGWVPFGGYVKISGMIDESMDKEQLKQPPKPYEFRSKPAWQRLIIMVAGVIMNVLLALFLFIMITYKWGDEFLPPQNLTYGVYADSLARTIGIQNGDLLLAVDDKPFNNFFTIPADIILSKGKTLQIKRNGQPQNLTIPDDFKNALNHNKLAGFVEVQFPVIVDSVITSQAKFLEGRLQKGDTVIAVNNKPFRYFHEFDSLKKSFANKVISLTIRRGQDTLVVKAQLNENTQVGFQSVSPSELFGTIHRSYSLGESIPVGIDKCFSTLDKNIKGLQLIITGQVKASESLGSVISIGKLFASQWDWRSFWSLTAILSIILAFMNILPIPA